MAHADGEGSVTQSRGSTSLRTDLIIVFFVLLGFLGSVALFQTSAPPIIIAVFLATGVSALIYRFLGGIEGASFTWGALKLTGTAAALVGIAFGLNFYLEVQTLDIVAAEGRYDWQFAGGGWKGFLTVEKGGAVTVNMNRYLTCNGVQQIRPLLRQMGAGTTKLVNFRTALHVEIPVQFADYDANCNLIRFEDTTTLKGDLSRRSAFAGEVEYQNKYGSSLGGIFLVKNDR